MHNRPRRAVRAVIAVLASFTASLALAHAKLTSSTPAADSTTSAPKTIELHFDEGVEAKMSSVKVTAADGTVVATMSMNDSKEPTLLSVMPNAPLKAGRYTVKWSAVTDDGHKTQGTFSFTVQ
jgi:methionine-rich copper-binding protein CopC